MQSVNMSRLTCLGLGAALGLLFAVGSLTGIVIYFLSGGGVDAGFIAWGCILFPTAWGAFVAFRRAFKPPCKCSNKSNATALATGSGASSQEASQPEPSSDVMRQSADEKLAALLRKPNNTE